MLGRGFVVFVFLLASTGLLIPLLRQEGGVAVDVSEGDPVTQAIWIGVYTITLCLLLGRWRLFAGVASKDKLLLLLVGMALLSVLWSAAPEVTLRRGVALAGTTAFGIYLATRYTLEGQLRLLGWALGIAAVLSLVFGLALPSYGVSSDLLFLGDWQGIYNHKNALGADMALGAVVFLILARSARRRRLLAWGAFGTSVCLLLLSDSKTALVVLLILLCLWPLYRALRWRYTLSLPVLIFAVLLGGAVSALIAANAEAVLGALGRDATLSGRTELWSLVWDKVRERPLLGYGYSAFWLGLEGDSASIWLATGSEVPAADNGFLDLLLNVGFVGMALFLAGFALAFLRAASLAHRSHTAEGIWPLAFLTFVFLYCVTESVVLRQNSTVWIVYVATVLSTFCHRSRGRERTAARRRRAPAERIAR